MTSRNVHAAGIRRLVSLCKSGFFSPTTQGVLGDTKPEPHLEVRASWCSQSRPNREG